MGVRRRARGRRRANHRSPLLQGVARPARLPRAQSRPRTLAGRRARWRGARAACGRGRRRRSPAGRAAGGRLGARATHRAGARRAPWCGRRACRGSLRPGRRRRWSGGTRRRRLRSIGGAEDDHGRARGAGRPGRSIQPHRELPRFPGRPQRLGPCSTRHRSSPAPGRRAARRAGGGRAARRGLGASGRAQRGRAAQRQLRAHRVGRLLPSARHARLCRADRCRRVLRGGDDRGACVRRAAHRRDRRCQLGRTGGRLLQRLRSICDDARTWPVAGGVDVALSDRADRLPGERPRAYRHARHSRRGPRRQADADPHRRPPGGADARCRRLLRLHRCLTAHRLARRRDRSRRARFHPRRAETRRPPAGSSSASRSSWSRPCRACSSPATCVRARSSASPAPSARARWPFR